MMTLAGFAGRHEHTVTTALAAMAREQSDAARKLREQHAAISADPARRAAQDATLMPTDSIPACATSFEQSAEMYQRAADDWDALMETLD